ncbi:hypothetical protein RYZ26_04050 [Terasakiella sp. A23]|uniref:hypothetical protein n=1 Tax=Terasakiella sp. FCG-A23 TaxID=3080561 RepID=UPI002955157C|nr:hypothetical protein [Terasakiella sp. A23]MDV7338753.1 hypothetical protein [Terasakiella sp. A23]
MGLNTLINPPAMTNGKVPGLCKAHPLESIRVGGVMDIVRDFDVVLFSAEDTLTIDGKTHPAGAVMVPSLRRLEKKLAVFSLDELVSREELTSKVNFLGMSFAPERILMREDFANLNKKFPFAPNHRILMVCSDVINEVALGRAHDLTTMLITNQRDDLSSKLGIGSHYVASSV